MNLEQLKKSYEEACEKQKELGEAIKRLESGSGRVRHGDCYWFVGATNQVMDATEIYIDADDKFYEAGNYFHTEQEAKEEVIRRESIAKAYKPKQGGKFLIWDYGNEDVVSCSYEKRINYTADIYNGSVFPETQAGRNACLEWGKNVAPLFLKKLGL